MKKWNPRRALPALLLALSAVLVSPAQARARDCTRAEMSAGDAEIVRFSADRTAVAAAVAAHLPWGVPVETVPTTNEMRLVQADYVIDYDADLRVPIWTAERIVAARLDSRVERTDCFRFDPRLDRLTSSVLEDYARSGHDRGHLAPFADQRYSVIAGNNSFILTNMAPQLGAFNSGIWGRLEDKAREWASSHPNLYVLSGSVFDRDGDGRRDPDSAARRMTTNGGARVGIPTHFFKIVAFEGPGGQVETITFLLPHDPTRPRGAPAIAAYLTAHITNIATIERLTGLDLFPGATRINESRALW
ncbi:MAG: endonuclease mitochondrial [Sphingomonadales bacterium]|jgi:DNA/RNA endonuclease G (NUC1)|nr:endonuclease mitochondrial [Sphingomonadales bacterium]MEA3042215.1 endonuclease mitochondrial [Sphingomonadales bacterium]MEA3047670.1 endonuclease mitochondrial [Sphingomonadales bacterium]